MGLWLACLVLPCDFGVALSRHISHFMRNVPFPSPQRPRILVQVGASGWGLGGCVAGTRSLLGLFQVPRSQLVTLVLCLLTCCAEGSHA